MICLMSANLSLTSPRITSMGEREILRGLVTRYREFWLRQPLELYEAACMALQEHYDKIGEAT